MAPGVLEKLQESHPYSTTEPEESLTVMLPANGIFLPNAMLAGRAYLDAAFNRPTEYWPMALRYERLFLTMLDAYRPVASHWTLKAPVYANCFPELFNEFPDAHVVVAHRNPLVTIPSLCRLGESWCAIHDRDGCFNKQRFGSLLVEFSDRLFNQPLEYRAKHPEKEGRIFDCMYDELTADPIAVVRKIYRKFALDYSDEFERKMRHYLAQNSQSQHSRHSYTLEEYGIDPAEFYARNRSYMQRFGFEEHSKRKDRPEERLTN